ncbi:EAL domain-containing protein [Gallaecimonas mangrovi]|uniref:EAL domain-containing protein n=1 Tax=Gallaecimonas mangrovi TaxID=2291597 RepID=UPI000E2023D7|nr:EAL domain-containing protein [Gallaecimonas mangrovi]
MWRWLIGAVLVGLFATTATAATNDILIRQWTAQEGLPNDWVNALLENKDGSIWVGTSDGLFRLTQSKALAVTFPEGVDLAVNTLQRYGDGFFVGTSNALMQWSPGQGLKVLASTLHTSQLTPGGVQESTELKGTLWLALGSGHLARLADGNVQIDSRLTTLDKWRALANDGQHLYLLSVHQLIAFDPATGEQSRYAIDGSRFGTPKSLYVDRQGQLWLTSDKGLFRVSYQQQKWQFTPFLNGRFIRDIAEDSAGGYYLTGRYGVQYWSPKSGQFLDYHQLIDDQTEVEGLSHIMVDSNGLVWAATLGEGVLAIIPKATTPVVAYSRQTKPALASDIVWGITRYQDATWLATDAGLEWLQDGQHQLFKPSDPAFNNGFYAVAPYRGQLAACGINGLYLFDIKSQHFTKPLAATSWDSRTCLGLYADGNNLFIGESDGLVRFNGKEVQGWRQNSESRALDSIKVFAKQGQRLWAAGAAGLLYLDNDQWHSLSNMPGYRVNAIEPMPDGSLLVGFSKEGVWRLDWQQDKPQWRSLSQAWDLPNRSVYFLAQKNQRLYIGMQDLVVRVKLDQSPVKVDSYFEEDGLPDDELNEGAGVIDAQGNLWVGTASGVAAFKRDSLKHRLQSEDNGVVYVEATTPKGTKRFWDTTHHSIKLPADLSLLSIQLGSQNYASKRLPHFRYKMSEQSQLVDLYSESPIVFGNLGQGKHQFTIWYLEQGRWREHPELLRFDVALPWYRSYFFFAGVGLLVLLLAAMFGYQRRRQRQQLQQAYDRVAESEHQLRLAMFGANVNTWTWQVENNLFTVSLSDGEQSSVARQHNIPMAKLPIHPEELERVGAVWQAHLAGNYPRYDVEHRILIGDQWRWIHAVGRIVDSDIKGNAKRVSGIFQDITERKQLEGEINLYARAFENTAEGVLILSRDKCVLSVNPAVERISGFDRQYLQDKPLDVLLPPEFLDTELWRDVAEQGAWTGECSLRRRDGSLCALWLNISQMDDSLSSGGHFVVVFSDMTERKAAEFELRRLANYDVLTGLPNRGMFIKRLSQAIENAQSTDRSLALLFMDLDRFKTVNDTYGHRVGDGLLVEAASRLQGVVGDKDTVARLGGDEFVVIIQNISGPTEIVPVCEALLEALATPFDVYGRQFYLSTSIGVSLYPDDGNLPEALLRNADMAMYHAKEEGRNNMQFYSHERNVEAMRLIQLESDLRLGLERDEFFVVYQPQVDVLEGELVMAVEALVRWQHPKDGLVNPDTFIKVAENCGLIAALDEQVLRKSLHGIQEINAQLRKPLTLNANISAAHFRQHNFVAQVQQLLEESGLNPGLLCLEITESTLMREVGTAREHLAALRKLGVSIAVDDFGTGYSSLAYLKQFAVNELKVDKSFVHDLTRSEADAAIVRSVVDLARNLSLKVVAEGVETEEQLDLCLALGCYRVQGYYYARPMKQPDLQQWLLDWNSRPKD